MTDKKYDLNLVACTLHSVEIIGPVSDCRDGCEAFFEITDDPSEAYQLAVRTHGNWMALRARCAANVHRNVIYAEMVRRLRLVFAVYGIEMPILETTGLRAFCNFGQRHGTPIEDTPAPQTEEVPS
jgi:hypothetical protein